MDELTGISEHQIKVEEDCAKKPERGEKSWREKREM